MPDGNPGDEHVTTSSEDDKQEVDASASDAVDASKEVSAAEARIKELETDLAKSRDILEKARKGEKYHKQGKQELEQRLQELEQRAAEADTWKAKAEQVIERENARAIDTSLGKALEGRVESAYMASVLELVNRAAIQVIDGVADAESVEAAVAATRERHSALFIPVKTPEPKRATEGAVAGGFAKDLAEARKQGAAAYQEFLRKNNLI